MLFKLSIILCLCIGAVSCAKDNRRANNLSEEQISGVVTTVNNGEIALAQHVLSKSQNQEVREFAQHMISDHSMNNQMVRELGAKKDMVPEASNKSVNLEEKSKTSKENLMSLSGRALDKAYIDDQVKTHQRILDDLEGNLIPSAKDEELKAHLEMTAEDVEEHLNEAKALQSRLI